MYVVEDDSGFSPTGASPFYFAIYFNNFDSNTNSWSGKVFANQNDRVSINEFANFPSGVINGTAFRSNVAPHNCINCLSDEEIFLDSAMRAYQQLFIFQRYATYPGNSLSDSRWASYDNPEVYASLNGTRMVATEAGTFDCTELVDPSGNTALISKDLPLPVAGREYRGSHYSYGSVSHYYLNYRLVQIGENIPTVPEFPLGITLVVLSALVGGTVAATRMSGLGLTRGSSE